MYIIKILFVNLLFPKKVKKVFEIICPPSKSGMGSKLIKPIEILKSEMNDRNWKTPLEAASLEAFIM